MTDMSSLFPRVLCLVFTVVLSGCVHVQLNSSVSGATIRLARLDAPEQTLLEQHSTAPDFAIQQLGLNAWQQLGGFEQLLWLGHGILPVPDLDDDAIYLLTASGGQDEDGNLDNEKDQVGTAVEGTWHALLTGRQIINNRARVSTLTEAVYRYLEPELERMDDQVLLQTLDVIAERILPDINNDQEIDYEDVLSWTQLANPLDYRRDIDYVDALSGAVIAGLSDTLVRDLSIRVIDGESGGFQIRGSITVAEFSKVDADVNDRNARLSSNDSILNPQRLDSPVVLGGYLNEAGQGKTGRSFAAGDQDDFYQVELLPGQLITLAVAEDPFANDLDLYLFDADHNLVDSSLGVAAIDSLEIAQAGTYIINVAVHTGASNYRLSVGEGAAPAGLASVRLSDEFASGELIVRQRENAPEPGRYLPRTRHHLIGGRSRAGLLRLGEGGGFLNGQHTPRMLAKVRSLKPADRKKYDTLVVRKKLLREIDIVSADLNRRLHSTATPNDPLYTGQRWHYDMLNLAAAWEGSRGEGVTVAVLDSGVLPQHPDLQGQLVDGFDFVRDIDSSLDGDGLDNDPSDPGDGGQVVDSSFHGTHVAGIVAAATDNDIGVAGVAAKARIMPLRVLGRDGGGDSYDIMQAVRYAAGMSNDSGTVPARAADIINLSLGGGGFSQAEQTLFSEVAARGIIVVAAAGNDGERRAFYPASYEDVISVTALNINREPAFYSNYHASVDIAAPGGDSSTSDINGDGAPDLVLSTAGDDSAGSIALNYVYLEGTSMAAPHVSGVLALMREIYPGLTHDDVMALLSQGNLSEDYGAAGRDNHYGWGLLNAFKAVGQAQTLAGGESIVSRPVLAASPSVMNFGASAMQLPLEIYNGGAGELQVQSVSSVQNWINIVPEATTFSRNYVVYVNRDDLAPGLHRGAIDVASSGGAARIPVLVTVSSEGIDTTGNAGYQYVLLIDPATDEMVKQDSVTARDGRYEFQFNNVESGSYYLVAGSDSDNDFYICDAGESCGAWPVLSGAGYTSLDVASDIEGLTFTTGFQSGVLSAANVGGTKGISVRKRILKTTPANP